MLILIIERAQKPALLKATTFLNVSMGTMTDVSGILGRYIDYKYLELIWLFLFLADAIVL